jgi:hypothetical protein
MLTGEARSSSIAADSCNVLLGDGGLEGIGNEPGSLAEGGGVVPRGAGVCAGSTGNTSGQGVQWRH